MLVVKQLVATITAGGVGWYFLTRARQICDSKAEATRRHRERWPMLKKLGFYDPESFRGPANEFMFRAFGVLLLLIACLIAIHILSPLFGSK